MVTNTTGLTHIKIKDQETKLKFGLPACQAFYLMCLADDSEKYINDTRLTAMGIAKLFFAAYENACVIDDKDTELTYGNFVEWVEDMILDDPKELERVVGVFSNSKYTTKLAERAASVDQVIDDVKKKLSIGNTSSLSPSSNSGSRKSSITNAPTASSSSGKRGTNVQKPKKRKPKR